MRVKPAVRRLIHGGTVTLFLLLILDVFCPTEFAQQTGISIGDTVRVVTEGQRLNLRAQPGLDAEITRALEPATTAQVIDGPEEADGYEWWQIEAGPDQGWAAARFLQVITSPIQETPTAQSATPQPQPTPVTSARHIASAYGFSRWCLRGWKHSGEKPEPSLKIDVVVTWKQTQEVRDLLADLGYKSTAYENADASDAGARLANDEVFYFFGHGANNGLIFHDDDCQQTSLATGESPVEPKPNLRLAMLLGCNTGHSTSDPQNVMRRLHEAGADKVIGFNSLMLAPVLKHWNKLFWEYAAQDDMEVGDAARKAALDNIRGCYWIDPNALVVVGNQAVYLRIAETTVPTPSASMPELSSPDIEGLLERWVEAIRLKGEQWVGGLERKLDEWFERSIDQFLTRLLVLLEEFCSGLCTAPVLGLVLAGGWRLSRRHKRTRRKMGE